MSCNILKEKKVFGSIFKIRGFGILIGLLGLFLILAILTPENFLKISNLLNITRQVSFVGIIAVGMTMVIVSGEFDLSVGSTYGMAVMVGAILIRNGVNPWLAVIIALLGGILIGLINGLLVTYGKIPSFIVTIGMLNIVRGFDQVITDGAFVNIVQIKDPQLDILRFVGSGRLLGVMPVSSLVFIAVIIIGGIAYHKTLLGLHMRAVGSNPFAAVLSGINVKRIKILSFIICGFLAALSGLLSLFLLNNGRGYAGTGLELDVIAATIIGGASLMGGIGTIMGTVIGVLIIGVLDDGMVLLGMPPFSQMIAIGLVIITAVTIDMWTRRRNLN